MNQRDPNAGRCPAQLSPLLSKLLDGGFTQADRAALQALLRSDAASRRYYLQFMQVHAKMQWSLGQARPPQRPAESQDNPAAIADSGVDTFLSTLDEPVYTLDELSLSDLMRLAEQEKRAKPIQLPSEIAPAAQTDRASGPHEFQQALSILADPGFVRYIAGRALRSTPALYTYAAAAILLLALILINPFASETPDAPKLANRSSTQSTQPGRVDSTRTIQPVATLTNTHHATWAGPASDAPAPGSTLHPNQRLTLTQGFAEIQTNRGAIAILQAPATIVFSHNDNAIELLSGKLVGICQTESSKGFLVKTEHADITDLGTEFGVHAHATGVETTVFTGEVEVTAQGATPQLLIADQTASLSIKGDHRELVIDNRLASGFDALRMIPDTYSVRLPGTGEGLELNTHDPNWRITAIDGQTLDDPLPLRVGGYTAGDPDPLLPSAMLAYNPNHCRADTVYRIETNLLLPDIVAPERVQVFVRFRMDNELISLHVNGQDVPVPEQDTAVYGRDYTMVIQGPLRPGDNHIAFEVENEGLNTQQNPVGIQVRWELQPASADPQNQPALD